MLPDNSGGHWGLRRSSLEDIIVYSEARSADWRGSELLTHVQFEVAEAFVQLRTLKPDASLQRMVWREKVICTHN